MMWICKCIIYIYIYIYIHIYACIYTHTHEYVLKVFSFLQIFTQKFMHISQDYSHKDALIV